MKRNFSSACLAFGLLFAAFSGQNANAVSADRTEDNYGAVWRSFTVHTLSDTPPVNTYSIRFATGIQISGDRVQLVDNHGKFVSNGQSRPMNEAVYAHVNLQVVEQPSGRNSGERHGFWHNNGRERKKVKIPVIGHAGRLVGKLFGRKNRKLG